MDFDKILQETLEVQRQANVAWAAGKKELFDDGGLTFTALGCGTMGIAILGGIMHALNNSITNPGDEPTPEKLPTKFRACVRSRKSALRIQEELGKYNAKLSIFENENLKAVQGSDTVLLGCQSDMIAEVLCAEGIREALAGKLLISISTGVSVKNIHDVLYPESSAHSNKCTIIRAVPNAAAAVRESMTVIAIPNPSVSAETDALLNWIFTRIGSVMGLPESNMDVCSALCGSGTAFVALMAEALADGAVAMGLPREEAYVMAAQTVKGTSQLLLQGGRPAMLRSKVATPDGYTDAGLQVLEKGAIKGTIAQAVKETTVAACESGTRQKKMKDAW